MIQNEVGAHLPKFPGPASKRFSPKYESTYESNYKEQLNYSKINQNSESDINGGVDKSESSAAEDGDEFLEKRAGNPTPKRASRKSKYKGSSAISKRRQTVTNATKNDGMMKFDEGVLKQHH